MKKPLPYGLSDFRYVLKKYYYIDKTQFIPILEEAGNFLYLIRPRRFGKSLFLNMLDFYYNVQYENEFELFKGLYIYDNPTPEKNSYHILKFDFSAVSTIGDIEENFSNYCNIQIDKFVENYKFKFELDYSLPAYTNMSILFKYLSQTYPDIQIYILIDEYDNFINNLLMNDKQIYEKMVSSQEAIYKEFFKLLKALTNENGSLLKKMFFTGVSPLALFDVTSGSNIGKNITNDFVFNDIVGITKEEFKELREYYGFNFSSLKLNNLDNWYNHYKFNPKVKHTIYNTDMIFYYIDKLKLNGFDPDEMVDINVRTDYKKLKYLVHTNNKLNGNFNVLKNLFTQNYILVDKIKDSFSAFELTKSENFISLLYYLGLITIKEEKYGDVILTIPNQTINQIMAEFVQAMLEETNTLEIDLREFSNKMKDLAFRDSLEVFYYLADRLKENTSIRDLVSQESDIKMFFMTYFSLATRLYSPISEIELNELNQGYEDIFLVKSPNINEEIPNILIEFKLMKKNDNSDLEKIKQQAKKQIEQYKQTTKFKVHKSVIVIFKGFDLVFCEIV